MGKSVCLVAARPKRVRVVGFILAGFITVWVAAASGQVVINEVVSANSDRLLQRTAPGYPRLGTTTPWMMPGYNDALWSTTNGPFGFGTFSGVTLGKNTSSTMQNKLASLYVRKAFVVTAGLAASTNELELVTRFNDGFIAFLNGVEVARRNMGSPGMFAYRDQTAFNTNWPNAAAITIGLGTASNRLWTGTNTLCIQTHNKATSSGDFLSMADLRIGGTAPVSLVTNNAAWKYFAGVSEPSGGLIDYGLINGLPQTVTWATLGYNDASWPEANGPFGFDRNTPVHYLLGENLSNEVYNIAASVYTRALFSATASEAASSDPLQLVIDYDDGIIVYLNGREVARRNVGTANTVTPYNTLAPVSHGANGEGGLTNRAEVLSLGAANTLLSGGDNVLSLQIHNNTLGSSDLIGNVTLSTTGASARTLARPTDAGRYFIGTREPQVAGTGDDEGQDADIEEDTPDSEGDWIELYNAGYEAINLTGWSLTDDSGKPRKWYFPAGSAIAARGYLIVMATGFDVGPINGATYLHTNFKLSAGGEYLGLIDASGTAVSEIAPVLPAQSYFHSYVRTAEGLYLYSDTPTPGAANEGTFFSTITAPPDFNGVLGGFYATNITLRLSAPEPDAVIRYTLNGSEPTGTNALYSAPLFITSNTSVRARCFKSGQVPSAVRTCNYLVAQSAARRSIPALCLTADPFFGLYGPNASGGPANGEGIMAIKGGGYVAPNTNSPNDKIWSHLGDQSAFNMPLQYGRSAERPACFEYYPTNGVPLRTDLGLRISSSGYSRPRLVMNDKPSNRFAPGSSLNKPSFNIFFRGELGESQQDYAFFPESRVTKFENMRLRAGKNDIQNPFIVDEFMRRIFIGTGQQGAIGTFVSVYINGVWKGYFNFCEHLREAFMQQHHNSSATWDVQQVNAFASGDAIHWNSTLAFLRTNDLTKVDNYVKAQEYVDAENVIDYLTVYSFAACGDWPGNNWVAARERSTQGRWRFYMWDAEMSFGQSTGRATSYNTFTSDLLIANAKTGGGAIQATFTLLYASPEFKLHFADRVQKHMFHNGCMTKASLQANFYNLRNAITPIMQETITNTVSEGFFNNWIAGDTRRPIYFTQLSALGLWPATLAPEFSQHGGDIAPNTQVAISNPNGVGTIYFTTNGVDPRALGGSVTGLLYTSPLILSASTVLKARVLSTGGEWSPLQEASFVLPVNAPVFQPTGSADWTTAVNWSSWPLPYPNGTNVAAFINAPLTADRDVNLRIPVTIGSLTVQQNDSAYRNRIRDRSSGNTLTFMATNGPAVLTVNGTGPGYVEFEVAADTFVASDLRVEVNNTSGSMDYGALRLRAVWRGPGELIKEGDGVMSLTGEGKLYTGATVINRGVLALTESASPYQSASFSVNSGGQLRLTSASTDGVPRIYTFGSRIRLDSLGRGGTLPPTGQGVSGALRYQPESDDSVAIITNTVEFAGLSGVHVEGSRNTLELTAPLEGAGGFIKTGGGNLILPTSSPAYSASIGLSNGTLTANGQLPSPIEIAAGAFLAGCGRVGPVRGTGTVALDRTILSATAATGLNYAFTFGTTGSPAYANSASSGNALLHLIALHPSAGVPTIDIYLDTPPLSVGDRLRGGFFVESGFDLAGFLASATVRFFEPSASGSLRFANRFYTPYTGVLPITATAMPETADFGSGPHRGQVMELRVAGPAVRYDEWMRKTYLYSEDQDNPFVSAPLANLQNDGVPNLLRYAFDIPPYEPITGHLPRFTLQDGTPLYQFRFDPGKNDLIYLVEASSTLTGPRRTLFDSRTDDPDLWNWDGESLFLLDEGAGPAFAPSQFYRLRVLLSEP